MPSYLHYWSQETVQRRASDDAIVEFCCGTGLDEAKPGDTLFIVTVEEGELVLVNQFDVDEIVSPKEAAKRFGKQAGSMPHCLACEPENADLLDAVEIEEIAGDLRIVGKNGAEAPLARTPSGAVDSKQFKSSLLELTEESAELLREKWDLPMPDPEEVMGELSQYDESGETAFFTMPEHSEMLQLLALKFATMVLEAEGWRCKVTPEDEGAHLLECKKRQETRRYLVCAVSPETSSVVLSDEKRRFLTEDKKAYLAIVRGVTRPNPEWFEFTGAQAAESFQFEPMVWQATMPELG
ncbi:MAG: hypothetical protein RLY93_09220 [Sumerlaeia bacterium]